MKKKSCNVSLVVSTYNWPEALNLCLNSIRNQTLFPDEVIIADDGSTEETRILVEKHKQDFPVPLHHIWQADEGFQLSKIRNKAIAFSSSEYIVQIDGDLILSPHFVGDHVTFRKRGTFVSGIRVQMSPELSKKAINEGLTSISMLSKGLGNFFNGFRIPLLRSFLASRYKNRDLTYVRGCNMAFWRADLVSVNGYDESIIGWGREDSELAIRLMNSSVDRRILKFGAVAFHIYHSEISRLNLADNDDILKNSLENNVKVCSNGISQYL